MDTVLSAIAGELISLSISFLVKKYADQISPEEKLKKLRQLLLRIHAIVEEADGRYITNPRMLAQLRVLVASMYHGYHMLDIFTYSSLLKNSSEDDCTTSSMIPFKRSRSVTDMVRSFSKTNDLQSVLENLEEVICNLSEFVVLLGGCQRMCRRPYDTYLYIDNFMFGRHVEKQQILNTLLYDPGRHGAPTVIPVIGGIRVGKKTLVSHVCKDDLIKSRFSSIMFIHGNNISSVEFSSERTLVVVEFVTDVDDEDWMKFYSSVICITAEGSKLILISRIQNLVRFGTVQPVYLNCLSHEEYRYLFKMLAFGSMDAKDYPRLASIADELAILLGGSLITANAFGDLMRRNPNLELWLRVLHLFKGVVDIHLSKYGEHPKDMIHAERPIELGPCASVPASFRVISPQVEREDAPTKKLPHVSLVELITGCTAIPNDKFVVVAWESRIPPYTRTILFPGSVEAKDGCSSSTRKRRSIV